MSWAMDWRRPLPRSAGSNRTGASRHTGVPFGVVVILDETVSQKLNSSSVFYVGGPLESQFVGFRTR